MVELFIYGFLLSIWVVYILTSKLKLNITRIFFFLFFLLYGPAYFIYHKYDANIDYVRALSTLLCLFVVFFFLGNYIMSRNLNLFRSKIADYRTWIRRTEEPVYFNIKTMFILVFLFSLIVFFGLFSYGGVDSLEEAFSNPFTAGEFKELRAASGVEGWISPFYGYITAAIGRFIAFLYLGYAYIKRKHFHLVLSYLFILLLFIGLLGNLSKSSAIIFLLQVIIFHTLLFNTQINFKKTFLLILIILPLLVGAYLIATTAEDVSMALNLLSSRIFYEPNRVLTLYTENYPSIYPHTYGMNIRFIHSLFGDGIFIPSEVLLADRLGSFNTIFIGDAWVDFSYLSVVFESFFLGGYLAFLDYLVFKKKNLLSKAILASLLLGIFSLSSIAMLACLITFGLLSIPLLTYFIKIRY